MKMDRPRPNLAIGFMILTLTLAAPGSAEADSISLSAELGTGYDGKTLAWAKSLNETSSDQIHLESISLDGSRIKTETTDTTGTSQSTQTSFSAGLTLEAGASSFETSVLKSENPDNGFSTVGLIGDYEYQFAMGDPDQPQRLSLGISISPIVLRQDFSSASSGTRRRLISAGNKTQELRINQLETKFHLLYKPTPWCKIKMAYTSEKYDQSTERLNEIVTRANLLKSTSSGIVNSIENLSSSSWKLGFGLIAFSQWALDLDMIRYQNLLDQSQSGSRSVTLSFRGSTWEPSLGLRSSGSDFSGSNTSDSLILELAINY